MSKNGSDGANGYVEKIETRGETLENAPVPPATFGQKTKRHFKRFWWLHLIIFCASFLIIALCLVYVAMPRIAQAGVNDSSLRFYELQFLNPTPNQITLSQKAGLHSPSFYTPTLDPFSAGLWLVTNGSFSANPFTTIQFPSIHALHPDSNITFANQVLPILDSALLGEYATQVLSQQNVTTALTGSTKLHEGKLPTVTVKYNSSSTYPSLNGLQGFNTTNLKLNLSAAAGEPNLIGNAFIPNPSVMTIEMGNVTLELSTAQEGVVGMATILDLTIRPGDNNLPMTAVVNETKILQSLEKNGLVTMFIIGNSSVYNGNHISYYETALSSNKLTLQMNVTQILADSAT